MVGIVTHQAAERLGGPDQEERLRRLLRIGRQGDEALERVARRGDALESEMRLALDEKGLGALLQVADHLQREREALGLECRQGVPQENLLPLGRRNADLPRQAVELERAREVGRDALVERALGRRPGVGRVGGTQVVPRDPAPRRGRLEPIEGGGHEIARLLAAAEEQK
ncbi:MAG: hypothetical protein ACYTGV_09210 [Planctomycetota bacterium]